MTNGVRKGFTLVELSIVLVVIALVIGGIMVGRDMVKAAEIRGTIAQIDKYNAAVNTFKSKYNYLPGDMPTSQASAVGFFAITGANAGAAGYGDGDGRIMASNFWLLGFGLVWGCAENNIFWRHLSDAQLIDGNFGRVGNAALKTNDGTVTGVSVDAANQIAMVFPPAKLGNRVYVTEFSYSGVVGNNLFTGANYFLLSKATHLASGSATVQVAQGLTPTEAYSIDGKIDDGLPFSGRVLDALGVTNTGVQGTNCSATSAYATDATYGNTVNCYLSVQFY